MNNGKIISIINKKDLYLQEIKIINKQENEEEKDIKINNHLFNYYKNIDKNINNEKFCSITPNTDIFFINSLYNVVVTIDVSSSMVYVDPGTGDLILDRAEYINKINQRYFF
jgi:hypothetical protein